MMPSYPYRLLPLLLLPCLATAQTDLPAEQVQVVKVFEAKLAETEKYSLTPVPLPLDTSIQAQDYRVPEKSFSVQYPAPRIRPVSFKSEDEVADLHRFIGKLGGGLPNSRYGEGSYHAFVRPDKQTAYDIGLNLFHHAADFSSDAVENQAFGSTRAAGKGTYYFPQGFAVQADMGYTANRYSYYGYNFDPAYRGGSQEKEAVRQQFGIFDFGAQLFNGVPTAADFNYQAGIDFYTMGDAFTARETGFKFRAEGTKWIREKHSFDLAVVTDFSWYDDTLRTAVDLHNYTLRPAFSYHGKTFKVRAGGRLVSHKDEFELFPDLECTLNLSGELLSLVVGMSGDLQKNNFRNLTTYNPYLYTSLEDDILRNTRYFEAFAGVRGAVRSMEYSARVAYKPTNDLALFVARATETLNPDPFDQTFRVTYDDVNIIHISATAKATFLERLDVTGFLSYNIFDKVDEYKAWHLPAFQANLIGSYATADGKLRTKAQLFLESGVYSNVRGGSVNRWKNLGGLYDVSLGAEYWFADHFGAFLDLNNLLNNQRERWLFYPTYGINVLGGVTARF
ncbi:MAG: hypothetical protein RLY31_263 [Bacteroidota bacterium]